MKVSLGCGLTSRISWLCNGGKMKRFTIYRRQPPQGHLDGGYANAPDEVQLEGCVFTDGTTVVRWRTEYRSTSVWDSFETFDKVHGHPEYETSVEWLDV